MAKLVLSYLSCYILKCLRPDSFRKSCDVRTCSFTFQSPIHLGRSASWTRVLLSHLFIFSQQLTYYQLKLSEMFTDGIFFFRHNWFPCLLLVRAKDLQCGQSRLDEDKFAWRCNPANHQYLFPVFPPPAISFFLLWSQDFSHFSSWISLGHNKAFPEEQYSCSPKLACDSEVKKEERGVLRLCLVPTLIAISSYEWVGYYRFYVLFICFCLSLHYIRRTV